ncbi:MAG: carboxypeptidase-like regulatory domain-containing protein, partial [Verrucomicrobiota bacterium]
ERNLAGFRDADEHTTNLDLTLQPCVTLSGKVVDTIGQPVTNAEGIAYTTRGIGPSAAANPSKSDARGLIEFTGLPQGDGYSLSLSAKGYVSASQKVKTSAQQTNHITFPTIILRPANKQLAGKVLDLDDKPVAGVSVQAVVVSNIFQPSPDQPETGVVTQVFGPDLGSTRTDDEGHFFFDAVCEGPIQLNANFEGFETQTVGGETNVVLRLTRNPPNGQRQAPIPMVKITGTVRDPAGAPAAGVRLSLTGDYGRDEVQSDSNGRYLFNERKRDSTGDAPHGYIVARDEERNMWAGRNMDDTTTNVDLTLRPGLTLSAHVRDVNGNPIPNAVATLTVETEGTGWNFAPMRAVADYQGLSEIKALPQARYYTATITSRGYGSAKVEAPDADTHTNHFEFPAAVLPLADVEVAGQVLDPDGKPTPKARVTLSGVEPAKMAITDTDGRFAFYGLSDGDFRLYVSNRGTNGLMQRQIGVRGGDTNVVIHLVRDIIESQSPPEAPVANRQNPTNPVPPRANGPMVTNYGRVLGPSGSPVSGVVLAIAPYNGMEPRATNDEDGNFSIVWPKWNFAGRPTRRFLYVRDLEHDLSAGHEVDESSTNLELRLQPGLPLSVKVLEANGNPVRTATANLMVFTGTSYLPFIPPNQVAGRPDDQGIIEIKTLPRGLRYSMSITAKGYGFTNLQAQFGDTQTNGVDFQTIVLHRTDRLLAGLVLGLDGNPVPEATVGLNGAGQRNTSTTTDAQGHFAFNNLVDGSVRLQASGGPMNTNIHRIGVASALVGETNVVIRLGVDGGPQIEADALARRGITNVAVRPATNPPTAEPTMTTSLTAFDPSGAPAAGVSFWLSFPAAVAIPNTDASGKTTISWRPKYLPTPTLVGRDLEHNRAALLTLDQMSTNVDLRLQEGFTLCGSVQDDKGVALRTATVALHILVLSGMNSVTIQTVKVDPHGAFTFTAMPRGQPYTVTASAPGFFSSSNFLVRAAQTQTASVQLLPIQIKPGEYPLEGRVVGPDGLPVAGANVRVVGTGQPDGVATTDDDGHFVLRAGEGSLRVTAFVLRNHPGGLFNPATIEAQAGDTSLVIRLGAMTGARAAASTNTPPSSPVTR